MLVRMIDDELPPRRHAVLHFYAKRERAARYRQEVADELGYTFASAVAACLPITQKRLFG